MSQRDRRGLRTVLLRQHGCRTRFLLRGNWDLKSVTIRHRTGLDSLSIEPSLMSSEMSLGLRPSTWHPTLKAVPKISSTVPFNSRARDLFASRMTFAMSMISSRGIDFECLMFFSFFRSRGGSLRARITRDEAEGTTLTAACRFWMVSLTVTRRPFCVGH